MTKTNEWYKVQEVYEGFPGTVNSCYFVQAYDEWDAIAVAQLHGWKRGNAHLIAERVIE